MTVQIIPIVLGFINVVKFAKSEFEGKIVGGEFSRIKYFPHSVYVTISSDGRDSACGASILNQALLLTAAHCLANCKEKCTIKAYTASVRKLKGFATNVTSFKIHEQYNDTSKANDIALMRLEKELMFGKKVKRVAIMKKPPKDNPAVVAGWGWIDSSGTKTDLLKHARQQVFSRDACLSKVGIIPKGTFCASDIKGLSYPERGDSGSALLIQDYIQIGIVSFKKRKRANGIIIYTNVPYYYEWIIENAKHLYCKGYKKKKIECVKKEEMKWEKKKFIHMKLNDKIWDGVITDCDRP